MSMTGMSLQLFAKLYTLGAHSTPHRSRSRDVIRMSRGERARGEGSALYNSEDRPCAGVVWCVLLCGGGVVSDWWTCAGYDM